MLQFKYIKDEVGLTGMYFVEYIKPFSRYDPLAGTTYNYFKFDGRDEWFRSDLARPLKGNYSYYSELKRYLDKELNLYLRKLKLEKLNVL